MHAVAHYQEIISNHFNSIVQKKDPYNLYEPLNYILSLGGKR